MQNTNSVHTHYFVCIIQKPAVSDFVSALWKSGLGIRKNGDPLGRVPIAYAGMVMIIVKKYQSPSPLFAGLNNFEQL